MNELNSSLPTCQACGRQDETLRLVSYPFVFSFVFMTFQRQFSGLWCRRHRLQYWLQAGLITSIFGWLGIPFGLLFTPVRLFQLMRGGIQPVEANAVLLKSLGDKYMQEGNSSAAIKCFEASLQYMDAREVREQLHRLYLISPREESTGWLKSLLLFAGVVFGFSVLGFLAGLFDYLLTNTVGGVLGDINLIVVILTWTPLVTMLFLSISLLRCVVEWCVRYGSYRKISYPLALGVISMILLINGVATGESFGDLLIYVLSGGEVESGLYLIFAMVVTLFVGGPEYIAFTISSGQTWGYIMDILLLVSLMAGIVVLWLKSRELSRWQMKLAGLRESMFNIDN